MKQRKLSIESKNMIASGHLELLCHPTDLRSAFEIARCIAIFQGIEVKVIEEEPVRHVLMKVNGDGNVQTIRTTIENMAKKYNIHIIFVAHPRKAQGFFGSYLNDSTSLPRGIIVVILSSLSTCNRFTIALPFACFWASGTS